jgi:allantoin racemase
MSGTFGHQELERRESLLRSWAAADVDVKVQDLPSGPASIESMVEEHLAVPPLVEAFANLEQQDVDAVIVGCFDDPGVDALRELAKKTLVIGPGAAAMHLAGLLGGSFGIITVPNPTATKKLVLTERLETRCIGIGLVDITVLGLRDDLDTTIGAMVSAGRELITKGAETLVLGCMSMAFLNEDARLYDRLGVPVLNPAKASLGVAETFVRARLMPSRTTFPSPPKLTTGIEVEQLLA